MESLTEVADRSDFAVFVFAGDDVTSLRGGVPASRSNAVFELGFLAGRLGTRNTCVVLEDPSKVVLPSDLAGMMSVSLPSMESSSLGSMVAPAAAVIQRQVADIRRREDRPVEYYSCFISYSWSDKDFAVRLHDDLQSVGVRCWLDAKELKIGDSLQDQIDRAIQVHDKVRSTGQFKYTTKSSWFCPRRQFVVLGSVRKSETLLSSNAQGRRLFFGRMACSGFQFVLTMRCSKPQMWMN